MKQRCVSESGPTWLSEVRCRLETGRQHQIRIHLSEAGHPIVGERVYDRAPRSFDVPGYERGYERGYESGQGRLLLHAQTLGFEHPGHGGRVQFERELPSAFEALERWIERQPAV
jgi:23S rRNA pseudouridine1911/1915/1917 synthase